MVLLRITYVFFISNAGVVGSFSKTFSIAFFGVSTCFFSDLSYSSLRLSKNVEKRFDYVSCRLLGIVGNFSLQTSTFSSVNYCLVFFLFFLGLELKLSMVLSLAFAGVYTWSV